MLNAIGGFAVKIKNKNLAAQVTEPIVSSKTSIIEWFYGSSYSRT